MEDICFKQRSVYTDFSKISVISQLSLLFITKVDVSFNNDNDLFVSCPMGGPDLGWDLGKSEEFELLKYGNFGNSCLSR